jgi:hypothetical protein
MSNEQNQQSSQGNTLEAQQVEQARKEVNRISEEIAQLAESDLQPSQFYSEFLQRVYFAMQGFGAAVWIRTPQGNLQLQCQINLREVGLDRSPDSRPMHDELLRQAAMQAKGGIVTPNFSHNFGTGGTDQIAGNPTDYIILLVPIVQEKQVLGLVEIWQDPARANNVVQSLYQFLVRMAAFISLFQRNHQLRTMLGQQDLWLKLETFARQIHASLHTTEVAYLIANEARRLIEVDRVSVATRPGAGCVVTAISGADVVEKRSNLVQLMRHLFDAVIDWGERLIYTGTKDDALPPKVLESLDAYLGESNSKILVVMPLIDEREKEGKKKARSALMMESFETNLQPEQLLARLDVVGRHAAPALYNAQEYRRIPMRFLWLPLAYVQDGLGGKTKAIIASSLTAVVVLILAMIFVPFPLKMDANGQALPKVRSWVYPSSPGKIDDIPLGLTSGSKINKGQTLFSMFDQEMAKDINQTMSDIQLARMKATPAVGRGADEKGSDAAGNKEAEMTLKAKNDYLQQLQRRFNANLSKPGYYTITAPKTGIILSSDFRQELMGRNVKPGDPLVRVGYTDVVNPKLSDWELELKIPQKHYGQVLRAFEGKPADYELDIDVLFTSEATRSYRAKLRKDKIGSQANTQKDDNNETEPVILAWARINPNSQGDIPESERIPTRLLLSGGEVHTRIRCGNHAMGYSLFYGVYEWSYEKVIFPYLHW